MIDGIAGYIWKGIKAVEMDEITAKEVEKIIDEKFKGMSFNLIMDLDIKKAENLKIAQIKREILNRLPRTVLERESMSRTALKKKLRKLHENLKEYDVSIEFRKKLSTRLTLWKMSLFNSLIITISIMLMLDLTFFHLFNESLLLLIVITYMLITLSVNLLFLFFPMKLPKKFIKQNEKGEDPS